MRPKKLLLSALMTAVLATTLAASAANAACPKCAFYQKYDTPEGGVVCANNGTNCAVCNFIK